MRKTIIFLWLIACIYTFKATAQTAEFPESPLGKIAKNWVEIINTGDEAQLKTFITDNFSEAALKYQKPDDLFTLFRNLQKQSGGIEVLRVMPNTGQLPMNFAIKSVIGAHFAQVTIGMNKDKLAGIGISKIENPALQNWKEGKLSEEEMIAETKRQLAARAENGDFSGVVLIAKDDKILLNEAYGFADCEAKIPNTVSTKFHIASVGKMFTSAAIATLVRAGKISYSDTIEKLLPDFPKQEVFGKITVGQLLSHSAGLGSFFESPGFDAKKQYRNATEEIAVYKDEPLFFEPGAKWRYSNAGFSLLGAIIEHVSGKTYLEYIRENVLKPLKMDDTDTNSYDAATENAAILYQQTDVDPFGLEAYRADRSTLRSQATGFGGGFSTALDLYKFAHAYRTGSFLGAELTETIVTPKIEVQKNQHWGYGIKQTVVNGEIVRGHSGGSRTDVSILWNSSYIVIVQGNVTPPSISALSGKIVDFITKQQSLQ